MTHYLVTETVGNKVIGVHYAVDLMDQQLIFEDLVREFGMEPYDEVVESRIFESEDDYVIQMFDVEG